MYLELGLGLGLEIGIAVVLCSFLSRSEAPPCSSRCVCRMEYAERIQFVPSGACSTERIQTQAALLLNQWLCCCIMEHAVIQMGR